MRAVELRTSANITVRRLCSPPLALKDRSSCSEDLAVGVKERSLAVQLPQKRLFGRFVWPQAAHVGPSGVPHASQKAFVMAFSALQFGQRIKSTSAWKKFPAVETTAGPIMIPGPIAGHAVRGFLFLTLVFSSTRDLIV